MSESDTTNPSTTTVQNVQMSLVDTVTGLPADDGFRFAVTAALKQAGYSINDHEEGIEAFVCLNIPRDEDDNTISGPLVIGDGITTDRSEEDYDNRKTLMRTVLRTGNSLAIGVPQEIVDKVDFDTTVDDRPVADVWAAKGAIVFTPVEERPIYVDTSFDPVRFLPSPLREDYLAIEERGLSFAERAQESGLTDYDKIPAEYQVEQRYKEAKKLKEQFEEQFENQQN